ncbi:MAG: Smr/MutS family protein [Parvularculaceae bacterium]|nr:Smr/MutS family protein [Parvularculaceae bacterium]
MRRRDLTDAERDLWSLATRDVKAAKKRRRAASKPVTKPSAPSVAASVKAPRPRAETIPAPKPLALRAPAKAKSPPVYGGGDPKADRRAAKGLIAIDARLDLHGLTEPVAQARVTRFILGAQEDGLRLVLVITGKGARAGGEGRGIIRTRFFDWIETAPLRAAIARAAPAKQKDGGDGAFYVFLKRKTRG